MKKNLIIVSIVSLVLAGCGSLTSNTTQKTTEVIMPPVLSKEVDVTKIDTSKKEIKNETKPASNTQKVPEKPKTNTVTPPPSAEEMTAELDKLIAEIVGE